MPLPAVVVASVNVWPGKVTTNVAVAPTAWDREPKPVESLVIPAMEAVPGLPQVGCLAEMGKECPWFFGGPDRPRQANAGEKG